MTNDPREKEGFGRVREAAALQAVAAVGAETAGLGEEALALDADPGERTEPQGELPNEASAADPQTPVPALVEPEPVPESSSEILFRRARELDRAGDIEGAIKLYRQLLIEEPDNIRARNNLGCLFDQRGQHQQALEQYEAARSLAPDNIEVLLNFGDTLVALLKYDQAEREYKRAQKLDPARPDVHLHLGVLYYKRGIYAQAEIELKKAMDLDAENPAAWFYRGESLNLLGRVDEAIEMLVKTAQLQPTNARAYYLLGILYDKKRLPEQAMAMYRKAREIAAS